MSVPLTTRAIALETLEAYLRALSKLRRLLIFDMRREAVLVRVACDPYDAWWVSYSVSRDALAALHAACTAFVGPQRVPPPHLSCSPTAVTGSFTITERALDSS